MNTPKLIGLAIFRWFKPAWTLALAVATRVCLGRRGVARKQMEAERLDRIRHPSIYLGK